MLDWLDEELAERKANRLLRTTRIVQYSLDGSTTVDGQPAINFGANDYLGLASNSLLANAVWNIQSGSVAGLHDRIGSGASPLVTGFTDHHQRLENAIAKFEGTESAILFSTGFAANVGTIQALVKKQDVIFSDALNHASIIDGCRLSGAKIVVYRHSDVDDLRVQMNTNHHLGHRSFVVTDSLFSMDGDIAPLPELVALCEQYESTLIIDEAHATGVYGHKGRGLAEEFGLEERIPVRIGTLSKAIGSFGGFVAGPKRLTEYLRNFARPYIYSTSMPQALTHASCKGLELAEQMTTQREQLRKQAMNLRGQLRQMGLTVGGTDSPIIPVYTSSSEECLVWSQQLREQSLIVPAIRPPTVPKDQSLLRISLSIRHTTTEIEMLVQAFRSLIV